MFFNLRDIQFPVRAAMIGAAIGDPYWQNTYDEGRNPGLCWEIDIETEERELLGSPIEPRIYCDSLTFPIRRWFELEDKVVQFTEPPPYTESEGARAFTYFGGHDFHPFSTLSFGTRTANRFIIHWEGVCSPYWEEPFYKNVPFRLEAEAIFRQITVRGSECDTDATMLARLSQYLDPTDFIQYPMKTLGKYDSGVEISYSEFGLRG